MSRRQLLALGWLAVFAISALLPLAALFRGVVHVGPGTFRPPPGSRAPVIALGSDVSLPHGYRSVVVVILGNVHAAGTVTDDIVALDGNVYLWRGARIERDILSVLGGIYRGPSVRTDGRLGGAVYLWDGRDPPVRKRFGAVLANSVRLGLAAGIALLLVGTALTVVFPWQVILISTTLRSTPWKSAAAGMMALLTFLFLVVPLGLSLAGLPFALLLSGAGLLAWLFGLTSSAVVVGRLVARSPVSLLWSTATGLVTLAVVMAIPIAGPLLVLAAGLAGAGALVVALISRSRPASLPA